MAKEYVIFRSDTFNLRGEVSRSDYWVSKRDQWQELAEHVPEVLAYPALSVLSERVFSAFEGVNDRHITGNVDHLTFIKMNPAQHTAESLSMEYHIFTKPVPRYYRYLLAFVFAIDEVNSNADILPNVTLGYHATDSCRHVVKAMDSLFCILSGQRYGVPNYSCQNHDNLAGVIGDQSSDTSLHIAQLLNIYGYAQLLYPSFFQTLPSDKTQYLAIAELLKHFGWTWIGVITSDDDAGEKQSQELTKQAAEHGICIEYMISLPAGQTSRRMGNLNKKKQIINNSTSSVVVLCGTISLVPIRFLEIQSSVGHKKTLIFSVDPITQFSPNEQEKSPFHGSLVFSPITKAIPRLKRALEWMSSANSPRNTLLEFIIAIYFRCTSSDSILNTAVEFYYGHKLHTCNRSILLAELPDYIYYTESFGTAYQVYRSVYAMAHALHAMQLYTSRNLNSCTGCYRYMLKIPISTCSEHCPPGYRSIMKRGIHRCCFECLQCSEGEISNETDKGSCHTCPEDQWPNDNKCAPKPVEYLAFGNDTVVHLISIISVILFLKSSTILGIFIVFRDTPLVKANNQYLSFILLVCIMLGFLCVFLFLGRPVHTTCMLRQTSFAIIFSVAISSILAKTIMVYSAFKATKPGSPWRKFIGVKITNCVLLLCSFIQVLISITWLSISPPYPESNTNLYVDKIIIQCNEGSPVAFSILLGYMGLLAAVTFIVAFLARNLPDSFNEAKYITFSMLVFCSVWIAFIPAYMSVTGKNTVLVEIFAILSSTVGILGCIFLPKCYIILVRPDLNSKSHLLKQAHNTLRNNIQLPPPPTPALLTPHLQSRDPLLNLRPWTGAGGCQEHGRTSRQAASSGSGDSIAALDRATPVSSHSGSPAKTRPRMSEERGNNSGVSQLNNSLDES
ncbi:PREDICTED: vomeronasal type-2 receptor 116-like [Nanorana parkeri]|uniref:vomeronasal type-2 receptor 116-like n=1 Tax=Nanorana parkeri TaxID=125878 RepID=UPI000854AA88|nr:PREDICTED: vomeronasal type-2 receptor 116-like [Nanorana parkeri]